MPQPLGGQLSEVSPKSAPGCLNHRPDQPRTVRTTAQTSPAPSDPPPRPAPSQSRTVRTTAQTSPEPVPYRPNHRPKTVQSAVASDTAHLSEFNCAICSCVSLVPGRRDGPVHRAAPLPTSPARPLQRRRRVRPPNPVSLRGVPIDRRLRRAAAEPILCRRTAATPGRGLPEAPPPPPSRRAAWQGDTAGRNFSRARRATLRSGRAHGSGALRCGARVVWCSDRRSCVIH